MEFADVVAARHSVRDFSARPVAREVLEQLLAIAAAAPSAMNEQPWRYYIVTDGARDRLCEALSQATTHLQEYVDLISPENMEEAIRWYSDLGGAPVVAVVSMPKPEGEPDTYNKLLSVGASVEHLLLAATDAGLAACNITFSYWVRDQIGEVVGVGDGEVVVSIIAIGYPGDTEALSPPHETRIGVFLE